MLNRHQEPVSAPNKRSRSPLLADELMVNVGIALVFAAFYLRFLKRQ